jgi:hypothetical protein
MCTRERTEGKLNYPIPQLPDYPIYVMLASSYVPYTCFSASQISPTVA